MKAGIMQPYFFPYLGYISLIKHTDLFILFDPVQFIRHGWIERNRILKPSDGWQYISVPLKKHNLQTNIKDIEIDNSSQWKEKILAQLTHYKRRAPYYKQTIEVIKEGISTETNSIVDLNYSTLKAVCEYLSINFKCEVFSKMDLKLTNINSPDEWALRICEALNINEYWNPPGGQEFFDSKKYDDAGIKLHFQKINLNFYSQRRGVENFIPGLSIIDAMMFNSTKEINDLLDDYDLL